MNLSLLKGSDGKISMMRVSVIMVMAPVIAMFILHNIVCLFTGCGFQSMGMEEVALITGVLGAKTVQSFAEGNSVKKLSDNDIPTGKTE